LHDLQKIFLSLRAFSAAHSRHRQIKHRGVLAPPAAVVPRAKQNASMLKSVQPKNAHVKTGA